MTAYLRTHKPARSQYRSPRREKPAGIIGVHTAENILDTVGPDTGAEAVADAIVRRADPGSYHDLVDSDSIVHLVDYTDEAYHIGTHNLNRRTTGVSFALKTSDWATMRADQREAFLRNGARAAAAQAAYHGGVPARFLTLAQALAGDRGFIRHGTADPDRRTDPGKLFPESRFLQLYTAEITTTVPPPPPRQEDIMIIVQAAGRAITVMGPGYAYDFPTIEMASSYISGINKTRAASGLPALSSPEVTTREYDCLRAALTLGTSTGPSAQDIARAMAGDPNVLAALADAGDAPSVAEILDGLYGRMEA